MWSNENRQDALRRCMFLNPLDVVQKLTDIGFFVLGSVKLFGFEFHTNRSVISKFPQYIGSSTMLVVGSASAESEILTQCAHRFLGLSDRSAAIKQSQL